MKVSAEQRGAEMRSEAVCEEQRGGVKRTKKEKIEEVKCVRGVKAIINQRDCGLQGVRSAGQRSIRGRCSLSVQRCGQHRGAVTASKSPPKAEKRLSPQQQASAGRRLPGSGG